MKRASILLLALICAILIGDQAWFPATAQGEGFQENFDDPQMPGWEHSPEAVVIDGVLRIGQGNFAAREGRWENFDLTFKLRSRGVGEVHINYRASDEGSYRLVLDGEGASLWRVQEGSQPLELARKAAVSLPAGEWIDLQVRLSGAEHSIVLAGEPLLSASDGNPLPPGTVIFASPGEQWLEVDEVRLQSLPGQPQAGEIPAIEVPAAVLTAVPEQGVWEALLRQLSSGQGTTIDRSDFFTNLILAVVTSFILSRAYVYWGSSLSNRRKFAANFMLITVTTTFIILVVRSSVALSLGLVGALSIIRFRAAIKEPEELAYLFLAIGLGIGLGDNQRAITLITLLVVVALIGLSHLFRQSQADMNLHLNISSRNPNKVDMQQVMEALAGHTSKLRLLRYDENADALELSYLVEFRHTSDLSRARAALQNLSPGIEVSFLDNRGIW